MRRVCLLFILQMLLATTAFSQSIRNQDSSLGSGFGSNTSRNGGMQNGRMGTRSDSLSNGKKEIPKGVHVWTVDKRFGDITAQPLDTVTHMFQNSVFTSGEYSDYNTTGNLGDPRINRIFINRNADDADFLFTKPYDYFRTRIEDFTFMNTLSPYTNLTYNFCGNRTNGEDHFEAKYGVNVNKQLGFGFHLNYLYGRGYYNSQSTSLFNLNLFGSYIADQYQAHLLLTTNSQKITENGGITDDMYITHPESFSDNYTTSEIPTMLEQNWNRNSDKHVFLTHRYSLGFHHKVKMTEEEINAKKFAMESKKDNIDNDKNKKGDSDEDEETSTRRKKVDEQQFAGRPDNAVIAGDYKAINDSTKTDSLVTISKAEADSIMANENKAKEEEQWMKDEYVPVTSFIHTAQFDTHKRIYLAYDSPTDFYTNDYYSSDVIGGDSINDQTKFYRLRNTFAISMLEGFSKWAFAGLKVFAASDLRHYTLPDENGLPVGYTNHNVSIGGQISHTKGNTLHYNATAETWLLGDDQAQVKIDGNIDLNFPLLGDTVTLAAKGFFHNERANYYLRHYHSRHFWWDDDLNMQQHLHAEGLFSYQKTRTTLRVGLDELTNYTYLAGTYDTDDNQGRINNNVYVRQCGDPITMFTAALTQKFTFGIINWESILTYQKSTKQEVLPVPALNIYTNLYLKFRIAKVLYTELGADARYFTSYEAPDYSPAMGQFVVQGNDEKVKIGNYPIINAYANFNLKGTRFFVMYTHANNGSGTRNAFLTPHYPINGTVLRIGLSWSFYN